MEKIYYNNNFERYIKEQADDFKMIPSKRVWHSLYNGMHPSRKWPSFLMFFLLTTGVLYIGKENTTIPNTTNTTADNGSYAKSKNNKKNFKKNKQLNSSFSEILNEENLYASNWLMNDYDITSYSNADVIDLVTGTDNYTVSNNTLVNKTQKATDVAIDNNNTTLIDDNTIGEDNNSTSKLTTINEAISNDKIDDKQKLDKNKIVLSETKGKNESVAFKGKKGKKDATTIEFYATPSVGFRKLNIDNAINNNNFAPAANSGQQVNNTNESFMLHKPALNLEAGFNFAFAATKKISLKAGLQLNLTNYGIGGSYLNHSVPSTLAEINPTTGGIDYNTVPAYVVNDKNATENIRNTTYQISLPVGAYYKLLAKNKFDLFIGASVQPTFVFGGNPNVISADKMYYITNPSLLRKWNMNTAAEAYINYKFGNINVLAGPQVRYQLFSTYKSNIPVTERLYNIGFKIGIAKSF
jgi:hypothetical protein